MKYRIYIVVSLSLALTNSFSFKCSLITWKRIIMYLRCVAPEEWLRKMYKSTLVLCVIVNDTYFILICCCLPKYKSLHDRQHPVVSLRNTYYKWILHILDLFIGIYGYLVLNAMSAGKTSLYNHISNTSLLMICSFLNRQKFSRCVE